MDVNKMDALFLFFIFLARSISRLEFGSYAALFITFNDQGFRSLKMLRKGHDFIKY